MPKYLSRSNRAGQEKVQAKPRKIREPRKVIVSFRLRKSEADLLRQNMRAISATGVSSLKQFCRKLAIDYAHGRMVYIQRVDRELDPDSSELARKEIGIQPPNCKMSDRKFLESLKDFLDKNPENWNRLRFFMMPAGWSAEELARFRNAKTDEECLSIAIEYLKKMAHEQNGTT